MSETTAKKGNYTVANLMTMTWPSDSACRSWFRRHGLGKPIDMGLIIGMGEKEGVSLFMDPNAEPKPEKAARKAPAKKEKAAPAKKAAAPRAAPAKADGGERAPRTSKYADLMKKAFKLACREDGVTRQELNELNEGKPLDWEGRLTRHAKTVGHRVTISRPDKRHPIYKARPSGGGSN